MKDKDLLVSIIVRTKDRPKLLRRALMSIAAQTYRPIEVVLVNDGGCDLDIEEMRVILGDVSLNYLRLEKNTGRAHAGNVGIENARGAYIGFLDDDDELFPEHVPVLVSILSQGSYKVAYTDSLMAYREYDADFKDYTLIKEELVFSRDFDSDMLLFENYIPLMCLLFETGVLSASGGFAVELDLYEDWDLLVRIAEKTSFYHMPKITSYYNQWNTKLQIAQGNQDFSLLERSYMKVLSRHWDNITVQRAFNYVRGNASSRNRLKDLMAENALLMGRLETLGADLKAKEDLVASLQDSLLDSEALIKAMTNTLGWRLLGIFRRVRNRLLSQSPGFRKNPVVKGLRVLRRQGLKALMLKANKQLLFNRTVNQPIMPVRIPELPIRSSGTVVIEEPVRATVSVIIPTKNAGDEFDYALRRIVQQEGIEAIELIIIDSGSEDRTLEISKRYTKNIFQIPSDEFHHGATRNIGAEKAGGEFLVFTVQDAIPIGNQWLYKLISPIRDGRASAVTVRQIPRSDADLFASWSIWGYSQYLGYGSDRVADNSHFEKFDDLDVHGKRMMAGLDNVCLGVKRNVFDSYRFKQSYAEDLELGTRLIQDGHVLMFQSSNAVVHSHTRPSLYLFKRVYVDTVSLLDILGVKRGDLSSNSILGATSCLYCIVKMVVDKINRDRDRPNSPEMLICSLVQNLKQGLAFFDPSWKYLKGDRLLDEYFSNVTPENHQDIISEISAALAENLVTFANFMKNIEAIKDVEDDVISSIYKCFSITAGSFLGAKSQDRVASFFRGI